MIKAGAHLYVYSIYIQTSQGQYFKLRVMKPQNAGDP